VVWLAPAFGQGATGAARGLTIQMSNRWSFTSAGTSTLSPTTTRTRSGHRRSERYSSSSDRYPSQ
jgi:hypothetical protein